MSLRSLSDAKRRDRVRLIRTPNIGPLTFAHLIASCEPEFPKLLVSLDPPPPLLTVLGNLALARPDAVAIVGAQRLRSRPQDGA
jgi:predicted Rossmann fold nucleotide-binding protein DprA/Smf involved in DNA uptake